MLQFTFALHLAFTILKFSQKHISPSFILLRSAHTKKIFEKDIALNVLGYFSVYSLSDSQAYERKCQPLFKLL